MVYVGDTVKLTPNSSSGSTLFSITGATSRNAVITAKQCFPASPTDNTTNSCVTVNPTKYGSQTSSSYISTDGNYYFTGTGNFYYLLQLTSATTPNSNVSGSSTSKPTAISVATITTTPPNPGNLGGGSSSIIELTFAPVGDSQFPGLTFGGSPTNSYGSPTNAYAQQSGHFAYINGGVFGTNTIKSLRLVCLPFKPTDNGDFSFYGTGGPVSPAGTDIAGGDISIFSVNEAGVTQLGTITIPSFTAPPYINYVFETLTNPIAVGANDQLTAYVSRSDAALPENNFWNNCNISAGI